MVHDFFFLIKICCPCGALLLTHVLFNIYLKNLSTNFYSYFYIVILGPDSEDFGFENSNSNDNNKKKEQRTRDDYISEQTTT